MNFFKILLTLIFLLFSTASFSDNHKAASDVALSDEAKQMLEELEEEVPLNDPFAGNEGTAGGAVDPSISQEEQEDEMSLYKFKLAGLISGKLVTQGTHGSTKKYTLEISSEMIKKSFKDELTLQDII